MKLKPWMIAVGVIGGFVALLMLSDRSVTTSDGLNVLRSAGEFQTASQKAAELALETFQKADMGEAISDDEKMKLTEAAKLFEAMRVYDPKSVTAAFGAGKCYMLTGEYQKASERLEQAYLNFEGDASRDLSQVKDTATEACGLLAEVSLIQATDGIANYNSLNQSGQKDEAEEVAKLVNIHYQKAIDYANLAVQQKPTGIRYLVARANIFLAVNQPEQAKKDLATATKLDPNDQRVQMLTKLMK